MNQPVDECLLTLESIFNKRTEYKLVDLTIKFEEFQNDIELKYLSHDQVTVFRFFKCHNFVFENEIPEDGYYIVQDIRFRQFERIKYSIENDGGNFSFMFEHVAIVQS